MSFLSGKHLGKKPSGKASGKCCGFA